MITLEHIRTLSATELRIMQFLMISGQTLEATQLDISEAIGCSSRQVQTALKALEERGIIQYTKGNRFGKNTTPSKGKIRMLH